MRRSNPPLHPGSDRTLWSEPHPDETTLMQELTLVIPALNEEQLIRLTVEDLLPVARRKLKRFELILVDDGSTDRTGAIMESLAESHEEIRVIRHTENHGLAHTFREAVATATYSHLTLLPGDLSYDSRGLADLFEAVGSAELILGYRENLAEAASTTRLISSRLVLMALWPLLGRRVRDVHGPVIYPVPVLRTLRLEADGFAFCIEALVKAFRRGVTLAEVPVQLNEDTVENSTALGWATAWHMARAWFRLLAWRVGLRR
jgi:dolichol-phosphate mannosyltransferase